MSRIHLYKQLDRFRFQFLKSVPVESWALEQAVDGKSFILTVKQAVYEKSLNSQGEIESLKIKSEPNLIRLAITSKHILSKDGKLYYIPCVVSDVPEKWLANNSEIISFLDE